MTVMIGVDIHFGPDSIRHKYHPGDDKCHAYGVLKIDNGGSTYANLYFDTDPAHIDKMIAELVALKQEMDPPVITDSAPSGMQDPAPVARVTGPYERERDEGDADYAAMSRYCPATTGPDDELDVTLYCDREAGHPGSHHAPGPDEGSEVAWSDEAATVAR